MSDPGSPLGQAASELASTIERSVARAVGGRRRVAVGFSGGVDSSILVACAKKHSEVTAVSGYVQGSMDSKRAMESAALMRVPWRPAVIVPEQAERDARRMSLPFEASRMDRSLWALYSAVSRVAAEGGAELLLLGQLADELFGGYAKYSELAVRSAEEAARLMEEDAAAYPTRGRVRDVGACSQWVEPAFPYESQEVVALAKQTPFEFKIAGGERKVVLRRAALVLGVPEELAWAPKKAAQYSSGVQKAVG